jgi:hypothetical protein
MIDTIEFHLDISSYPVEIRNNIVNHWKKKESYNIENSKAFLYNNIENVFTRRHINFNVKLPSSNYTLNMDFDDIKKSIKFNFSIPKFLYGINLFPSYVHYDFNEMLPERNHSNNLNYACFCIMLTSIFHAVNQISDEKIPLKYILDSLNITRIDICRNYLFNDESDCIAYLEGIKRKKIPYKDIEAPQYYKNSLMYVFQDHSIKIYHKGSEMDGDYDKLKNIYSPDEIHRIREIAKRTLRYECTLRTQKIRDLFLKTFRTDCELFQSLDDEIKRKFATGSIKVPNFNRNSYYEYTSDEEYSMMFKFNSDKINKKFQPHPAYNVLFDFKTFESILQYCDETFNKLQVSKIPQTSDILKAIKGYNRIRKRQGYKEIQIAPFMKIVKLLQKNSLDELVSEKIISKQSKYNYIKKFNQIGISITSGSIRENYIENMDLDSKYFLENIMEFNEKMIELSFSINNDYLVGIREQSIKN